MEIQQNEIVVFILMLGVLIFYVGTYAQSRRFPGWKLFLISFSILTAGFFFTNIEGVFYQILHLHGLAEASNILEHSCYVVSAIVLALWSRSVFGRRSDRS